MKNKKKNYCNKSGIYEKQDKKINPILVKKYIKYIDWILLVYFYEEANMQEITELKSYTKGEILEFCAQKQDNEEKNNLNILEEQEVKQEEIIKIENMVKASYPYELATKIPTKSSVTKIKQQNEERLEVSFGIPKFMGKDENTKLTGAQKGTLLHLCMQKLDVNEEYDLDKIKQLVNNLQEKEIITKIEAENINLKSILTFTTSKIWQDMKQAKILEREKPFYITVPAKEIYQEEVEEDILVQGIIDLYYINQNDELILVDYKTDYVETQEDLIYKYQKQLELYKRALEEALGQRLKHVFIYSTFLGKEVEI